jgi:hypothetical protein
LSCQLPNLLCNRVIIFTASIPLVAHSLPIGNAGKGSRSRKNWLI